MELYHIQYSDDALEDIREIYYYIAFELAVPETARKQITRIRQQIRGLETMPNRYSLSNIAVLRERGVRQFTVNNYYIFYCVDEAEKTVSVSRIIYTGRDITRMADTEI